MYIIIVSQRIFMRLLIMWAIC